MNANEEQKQQYNDYVKQVTPTHNLPYEMFKAFLTGGTICLIGQVIRNLAAQTGMDQDTAGAWCSILLVFLSILLTGLNIYPSIAKWGGAGALVPITGFANGVAAPAIEYKKEGQVFGIGSKILRALSSGSWCNPKEPVYSLGLLLYIVLVVFFA